MRPAYRQSRAASRADEKGSKDRFAAHEAVWLGEYSGCRELIERFYVGELPSARVSTRLHVGDEWCT